MGKLKLFFRWLANAQRSLSLKSRVVLFVVVTFVAGAWTLVGG